MSKDRRIIDTRDQNAPLSEVTFPAEGAFIVNITTITGIMAGEVTA